LAAIRRIPWALNASTMRLPRIPLRELTDLSCRDLSLIRGRFAQNGKGPKRKQRMEVKEREKGYKEMEGKK